MTGENGESSADDFSEFRDLERRLEGLWQSAGDSVPSAASIDQQRISHFQIRKVLGRGAFGIVYFAIDQRSGCEVALKVPRPEVLLDPEKRKRFEVEAAAVLTLDHPNIVQVYEADLSGPAPFIAAAYCDGPNLAEWIERRSEPPDWQDSARLIAKIADAVEYAHQCGVVHRDLKPANVMLASADQFDQVTDKLESFEPQITDFGLAKLTDPMLTDTRSSLLVGTPMYMAPEQMDRRQTSGGSGAEDVYSLGVMLFELLTQRLPIRGETYFEVLENIRGAPPLHARNVCKDLPKSIAAICNICLKKNPAARYSSAGDLANDLRNCIAERPIVGKSFSSFEKMKYWATHPDRIRTAAAFTLGAQAVILLWFIVCTASLCLFDLIDWGQYLKIMLQDAMIITCSSCVMCWAGWQALRGRHIGIAIAMLMTMLVFPLSLLPLFGTVILFQPVYANQPSYFSFVIHMVPATGFLIQFILLICALMAIRRKTNAWRFAEV